MENALNLELLTWQNLPFVRAIHRQDISEDWVDTADTLMELTEYALEHRCMGHTYAVKYGDAYIGLILLGEAIPWETDPPEMAAEPFYRLMGFILDRRYRSRGLGGQVLEEVIARIYQEYGPRPIALGVHRDNLGAARFYERHGFRKTEAMEGSDCYYLRYPLASFLIRRAVLGDARTLASIQTASWRAAFGEILAPEVLVGCTNLDRAVQMYDRLLDAGKGNGYIGLVEGKPHCIAWWDRSREPELPDHAEIICIHSLPENWRRGYGSRMMDRLLADIAAAGYQKVMLWVFTENHRARAFYEAKGFAATQWIKAAMGTEEMCYLKGTEEIAGNA